MVMTIMMVMVGVLCIVQILSVTVRPWGTTRLQAICGLISLICYAASLYVLQHYRHSGGIDLGAAFVLLGAAVNFYANWRTTVDHKKRLKQPPQEAVPI